jgi:DNA (cytosine-5)-methyltransferase 3A
MSGGINVLSFFDGMSSGQIALNNLGINVRNYFAAEIKKSAIQVTKQNFPGTHHIGDVCDVSAYKLPKIDLFIGGSPCQDFSIARTGQGLERKGYYGEKSKLFFEYVRMLGELKLINPDIKFLLENVSMKKEHEEFITNILGVEPITINSNLFSFQSRKRLYWTNIDAPELPGKKNTSFQNHKSTNTEYLVKFKVNKTPSREKMWGDGINGKCKNVTLSDTVNCLTLKQDRWNNSGLVEHDGFCRYLTTNELEAAQTVPIGYCDVLSRNQAENVLGDGWTVDVIAHIFKGLKG